MNGTREDLGIWGYGGIGRVVWTTCFVFYVYKRRHTPCVRQLATLLLPVHILVRSRSVIPRDAPSRACRMISSTIGQSVPNSLQALLPLVVVHSRMLAQIVIFID